MTLAQTLDQYKFATVYDQELTLYTFHQVSMSNPKWYERFNMKVDVYDSIVMKRHHKALLGYVSQEAQSLAFDACMD